MRFTTLLRTLGCSAGAALLCVCLAGCMTKNTSTAGEKCDDCCKDDGKAAVVNKAKESTAQPATQPSAAPATRPSN